MGNTAAADAGLQQHLRDWHPAATSTEDVLEVRRVHDLAATLDLGERFTAGQELPPLWQWIFFAEWPATAALGPDGHPEHGHFLPPIPHRRRMFAGGRVAVTRPLEIGLPAHRESELAGSTVKNGRTGEMLFVTVRHRYHQDGIERLVEEQDLVYRSDAGTSTSFSRTLEPGASTAPWSTKPDIKPVTLFRFSAVTANAHRIHYDEPYATAVEGFPALVVHGPLLAIYMAGLIRSRAAHRRIVNFSFVLRRPVFLGDAIRVQGTPQESSVTLDVTTGADTIHATATAELA